MYDFGSSFAENGLVDGTFSVTNTYFRLLEIGMTPKGKIYLTAYFRIMNGQAVSGLVKLKPDGILVLVVRRLAPASNFLILNEGK